MAPGEGGEDRNARGFFAARLARLVEASGLGLDALAARAMRLQRPGARWRVTGRRISAWTTAVNVPNQADEMRAVVRALIEHVRPDPKRAAGVRDLLDEEAWERWWSAARKAPSSQNDAAAWQVPSRNPHFAGREGAISGLRSRYEASGGGLTVCALYGLGGVGKTQTALEYVHRFSAHYELVWWIDCGTTGQIVQQLARLAERCGLPVQAKGLETLAAEAVDLLRTKRNWLLVFDNVEHPAEVADLGLNGPGHVLVTTRFPDWIGFADAIELDLMSRADGVRLLEAHVPGIEGRHAEQIADRLGDLPLALAQAASFIRQTGITPTEYLRLYGVKRDVLLKKSITTARGGAVSTVWSVSLDRLRTASGEAVSLLQMFSCLGAAPIPTWLVSNQPTLDEVDFYDAVAQAASFSLVRPDGGVIRMHKMVQLAVRLQMSDERFEAVRDSVERLLAEHCTVDPDDPRNWRYVSELAPHLLAQQRLDEHDILRAALIRTIRSMRNQGMLAASLSIARDAHRRWLAALGAAHRDTLQAGTAIVGILYYLGQYAEAVSLGGEIHQATLRLLGPGHEEVFMAANAYSIALYAHGDLRQACEIGRETYRGCRDVLGADHPETLAIANNLANYLDDAGLYAEALAIHRDNLERCTRLFGPSHPYALQAATNISFILEKQDSYHEAAELAERALDGYTKTLGPEHPDALRAANNLAHALLGLGELDRARTTFENTLEQRTSVLGGDHPDTLRTRMGLARTRFALGERHASTTLAEQTATAYARVLGPLHLETFRGSALFAELLLRGGNAERARELLRESVDRHATMLGDDHPEIVKARNLLK